MIALVAGATGLVGGHLVRQLAADPRYDTVLALTRRPLPAHLALPTVREVLVDYDDLESHAPDLAADHVFCALGTTIRAAGSRERFREVDLHYVRALARVARATGARHFSLVSSVGAAPGSRVFYTRTKGEAEEAVREAGYESGAIFRPSVLGGEREEERPLERLGQRIAALVPGRYRAVPADAVATAMIDVAGREEPGWSVVESEEIRAIARKTAPSGEETRGRREPLGRSGSAALVILLGAVGFTGCARGERVDRIEIGDHPAAAASGRRCLPANDAEELPTLDQVLPPGVGSSLALWGYGGEAADTLALSIRYGPDGDLQWVRLIGEPPTAGTPAELERLISSEVPPTGKPDWGVRLLLTADGTPVGVQTSIVCPAHRVSGLPTLPLGGSRQDWVEMRSARGRRMEALVLLDDRGRIVDVEISRGSGSRLLDQHFMGLIRDTSFNPRLHDGFPVASVVTVTFDPR